MTMPTTSPPSLISPASPVQQLQLTKPLDQSDENAPVTRNHKCLPQGLDRGFVVYTQQEHGEPEKKGG